MLRNKDFYNSISEIYDDMISFDEALPRRIILLRNIINPGILKAADIGCGTGIDSLALASLGLDVTGFDPSAEMIRIARQNAGKQMLKVKFENQSAIEINEKEKNRFDLVVSLGNTFANIPESELSPSIKKCKKLLKTGGLFVLQILNYKKILKEKKRIVKISSSNNKYFIRFYDLLTGQIQFNILSFEKSNPENSELISAQVYPYSPAYLKSLILKAGFREVKIYSGLKGEKFLSSSHDLFIFSTA